MARLKIRLSVNHITNLKTNATIHSFNGTIMMQIILKVCMHFPLQGDEGFPGFPGPKVMENTDS